MNKKYYLIIGISGMVLWLPYIIITYYSLKYLNIYGYGTFITQIPAVLIFVFAFSSLLTAHDKYKKNKGSS